MNVFRTPTPPYTKQPDSPRAPAPAGALGWFASLLRSRTPTYTYPAAPAAQAATARVSSKP